jgi:hypothetical protein
MAKVKARMGRVSYRAKTGPPVAAKGVEATPGVMNGQGLSLESAPIKVVVGLPETHHDFWDQAIPRVALESFIDVPKSKRCGCSSVFPWSKRSQSRG